MISIDPRDPRPLYEQVVRGFRNLIAAGILKTNDQLPSVRALASQLAINPNTIQRAYRELEAEGCIYSTPGKGSFVAQAEESQAACKAELFKKLDDVVKELLNLGCTQQQLADYVKGGQAL